MNLLGKIFAVKDQNGETRSTEELTAMAKRCVSIAWPSTVEGALISIIGSVDTMMVGGIGTTAIAAVGLTNQPRMILLICAQALCVGTTALCARRKGADDRKGANSCLMQSLVLVSVLGLFMMALGYFGAGWFMRLAGANEDTMAWSTDYFQIISLGMMFNCWSLCICAAMRAIGKTQITMVTNITANLVNVCLNYVLIGGHFGFPALGVRGAAIATVCGTAVSCFVAIGFVLKKDGYYHFALPKFDKTTVTGLTKVGSSSIMESVCLRVGFLITARLVAGIGTDAFAAYQIVNQVTSLSFTLGDGAATAGTALVGQSLGAKRKDLAMINAQLVRRISLILSILLIIFILALRRPLALLFTKDEAIIYSVGISFLVVVIGMIPQNGRVVYSGCLRGAGDVKYVAMVALISVAIFRPILTYLCCYPLEALLPGHYIAVMGPWIAFVLDAFIRDYLYTSRIKKGKWLDIRLS